MKEAIKVYTIKYTEDIPAAKAIRAVTNKEIIRCIPAPFIISFLEVEFHLKIKLNAIINIINIASGKFI